MRPLHIILQPTICCAPLCLARLPLSLRYAKLFLARLQPLDSVHGRKSAIHNAIAGAVLVYVSSGKVGIPFVDHYFFYRYPRLLGGKPVSFLQFYSNITYRGATRKCLNLV
jgi:hypothetical protein